MASGNPSSRSGATPGTGTQNGQQGPGTQPEPGRPVQLVHLDEEGGLILDEEALSCCLEQGGVGDAPICLVSIIGEQRRGKSFLMNCLLRRLQSPEAADASWMGREDQALVGFECRTGMETVTRGVWMWDQPLWVQAQGRRVAVFLVDTEGSLDLERRMETSIKLSVFSILLSSYWIFNISSTFTRMEVDYLEMFIQVAKEVGETCDLAPVQRLDLLVRDWSLSGSYGTDEGQEYLGHITQKLEASAEQPLVLGALKTSSTRCYLLPHPGIEFTRRRAGTPGDAHVLFPPADMDEDFQQYLCDYVSTVECSTGTHVRTDRAGQVLTGAQLAARIKGVSRYLKTKRYDFSSPVKVAKAFAAMRGEINSKAVEAARQEYEQFVQQLDRDHQSMSNCLRVKPLEMQQRLEKKRQELLERCRGELRGEDPQKQAALEKLEQELEMLMAQFLLGYEQRFKMAEVAEMREKANRKAVEAVRQEYEQVVQDLDRDHQSMRSCLSVKPAEMQRRLEGKCQELLEHCRGELLGEDPQKQAALDDLKQELDRQMDQFLSAYKLRFKMVEMAAMIEEENSKAVEATKREFEQFVQQLDRDHQSMSSCLRVKPAEMQRRLEGKRRELLERCRGELRGEDPQKLEALEELEQGLERLMAQFLLGYEQRFKVAEVAEMREKANRKAVEAARQEYEQFVQDLDCDHHSMGSCLRVKPAEMQQRLEGKHWELLECCRGELLGEYPQKQAALDDLKQELDRQMDQFLSAYKLRFKMAEMAEMREKTNSKAVEVAKRDYEQFVQQLQDRDHQSMSSCLSVKPADMRLHLEGKRWELLERCRGELLGEDPQKQEALEKLKQELDRQMDKFLRNYEPRFKMAEVEANRKEVEVAKKDYDQFVKQLDRDHQSMSSCLRVKPAEMQQRLEGKQQELLERCWGKLRGEDPQKQAALEDLEQWLAGHMAQFLTTYKQRFKNKTYLQWGARVGEGVLVVVGAGIGGRIGAGVAMTMVGVKEAVGWP